jgi:hypothetical protein
MPTATVVKGGDCVGAAKAWPVRLGSCCTINACRTTGQAFAASRGTAGTAGPAAALNEFSPFVMVTSLNTCAICFFDTLGLIHEMPANMPASSAVHLPKNDMPSAKLLLGDRKHEYIMHVAHEAARHVSIRHNPVVRPTCRCADGKHLGTLVQHLHPGVAHNDICVAIYTIS